MDCLRSLECEIEHSNGVHVAVADGGSGDQSVAFLTEELAKVQWPWASFCPLPDNRGFAAGNNALIKPAMESDRPPRYVILLNPDTIVRPGALKELITYADEHPSAAIIGTRLEDPDGTPQRSAFRFPGLRSEIDSACKLGLVSRLFAHQVVAPPITNETTRTDWVAGACMLVRREVFETIGYLDDGFFMYFEEVDFCKRARDAGYETWYLPCARVVHLVGQASGVTDSTQRSKRRPAYWFRSRQRYFRRHHGRFKSMSIDFAWLSLYPIYRLRTALFRRRHHSEPKWLWWDMLRSRFC